MATNWTNRISVRSWLRVGASIPPQDSDPPTTRRTRKTQNIGFLSLLIRLFLEVVKLGYYE
jgi:hypothetical protein